MALRRFSELSARVRSNPERRRRAEPYKRELLAELSLADVRRARQFTQAQLACALKTTQSGVSRIEGETDLYLSTLRSYIEAMGGQLVIEAVFPDGRIPITTFGRLAEATPFDDEHPDGDERTDAERVTGI